MGFQECFSTGLLQLKRMFLAVLGFPQELQQEERQEQWALSPGEMKQRTVPFVSRV